MLHDTDAVRHLARELIPRLGEDRSDALRDPVDLGPGAGGHGGQHDLGYACGVRERVGQRERRPPRHPVEQPRVDTEMFPQRFEVIEQRLRRVLVEAVEIIDRPWRAPPTPPLIDADDEVRGGVEATPVSALPQPAAGPTVQVDRGLALRVARRLPVQLDPARATEPAGRERLDRRMHRRRLLRRHRRDPGTFLATDAAHHPAEPGNAAVPGANLPAPGTTTPNAPARSPARAPTVR